MLPTKNDIPETTRRAVVELLNERLADAIDLALQAKQAHWNVRGPHFRELHELFDEVHAATAAHVDTIAERAAQLAGDVRGTVRAAAAASTLAEYPAGITDGAAHVAALSSALADFGRAARRAIDRSAELGDADTADLFTEVSRGNDELLWKVEAHAQAER